MPIDQLHILGGYVFEGVEINDSLAEILIACQTIAFSLNFIKSLFARNMWKFTLDKVGVSQRQHLMMPCGFTFKLMFT